MTTGWLAMAGAAGATGVALGAFAAHGLEGRLEPQLRAAFETGVRYHLYHAVALLALGLHAARISSGLLNLAGWLFAAGIVVFSGSLYLLALTGARWLGAITPLGGLAFILGWIVIALAALRS